MAVHHVHLESSHLSSALLLSNVEMPNLNESATPHCSQGNTCQDAEERRMWSTHCSLVLFLLDDRFVLVMQVWELIIEVILSSGLVHAHGAPCEVPILRAADVVLHQVITHFTFHLTHACRGPGYYLLWALEVADH